MQRKFYLDTSVWRDYFEDRKNCIRPLGDLAFQFLKMCRREKHIVLVSPIVEKELLNHYSAERVGQVFSSFIDIIVKVGYSETQLSEARSFWEKTGKEFPFSDVLHSVIARDCGAVLVCRDWHFREIKIADCSLPEEID
ncbi:MAG: type II toxin-antitoxin system VapC family toxin [Candidatus Diapherotrites archaeon]